MAEPVPEAAVLDISFEDFAQSHLSLFSGPNVVICIGSASHEYRLPKALLCSQSPYFAAMFREGHFKEGAEQSTTLEEIEGVLSIQSFEMFVQWLYRGRIIFGESTQEKEEIALSIEFARLADMYIITGAAELMAEHIKSVILADVACRYEWQREHEENTDLITTQHVKSAALLPSGHPIRGVLAMAIVQGFFQIEDYKFQREIQEIPSFAVDVLAAVKATSKTFTRGESSVEFKEPLTASTVKLRVWDDDDDA